MSKHPIFGAIVAFLLGFMGPLQAETPAPTAAASPAPTWQSAKAALDAAQADVARSGSILGLESHAADLEQALAGADAATTAAKSGDTVTLLTDGGADTLAALAGAATQGRKAVAVRNPYPLISLYLGSYYNEIGQPVDADRVLAAGIALYEGHGGLGDTLPRLIGERGVALGSLKRFDEALAVYDQGIALPEIRDPDKARMLRGRGFVLTEMGRLDEAEAAYHESLKLDPNSEIAKGELDYIARLKADGPKVPSSIATPGAAPGTAPKQ